MNAEYERAAAALRPLAEASAPSARLRAILPSVRKVYAAALFASRHEGQARAQIETLLREDPSARVDPAQYEAGFVRLFDDTARALRPELDRLVTERVTTANRMEFQRASRQRLAQELLTTELRVERSPRWLAFVPFGVGQFVNHQPIAGGLFLGFETAFVAASVVSLVVHQSLVAPQGVTLRGPENSDRATLATQMEALNYVSLGLLAATVIAGVIHANVQWVPERVRRQRRPLPRELDGVEVSLSPLGLDVRF